MREPWPLPAEGHRRAGRDLRTRCARQRELHAAARHRQDLPRRARRRRVAARCARCRHNLPAERDAFVGRAADLRAIARRLDSGSAPRHPARPRRHRQDATRDPLRASLARRLAGRRLVLRPVGGAIARRHPLRRRARARRAPRRRRPRGAARPRDRRPRPLPRRARQLRAGRASTRQRRVGRWLDVAAEAAFVVTSRERLHLAGRRCQPVEPLPLDERRDRAVRAARAGAAAGLRARRRQPRCRAPRSCGCSTGCRWRSSWRRRASACCRRRSSPSACAIASAARRRARHRARQATLRGGDRLVVAAARAVGAGGAGAVLGVRRRLHARGRRSGARSLRLARRAAGRRRGAGAGRQEPAAALGADRRVPRGTTLDEPYFGMYLSIHEYAREKCRLRAQPASARRSSATGATSPASAATRRSKRWPRTAATQTPPRAATLELDNLVTACRRAVARGDGEIAVATYRAAWEVLA